MVKNATNDKATKSSNTEEPYVQKETIVTNEADVRKAREHLLYGPNRNFKKRRNTLFQKSLRLLRRTRGDLLMTFNNLLEDVDDIVKSRSTGDLIGKEMGVLQVCFAFAAHCVQSKTNIPITTVSFQHKYSLADIGPLQDEFLERQNNDYHREIDQRPSSAIVDKFFVSWDNAKDHSWDACLVSSMAFLLAADPRWLKNGRDLYKLTE